MSESDLEKIVRKTKVKEQIKKHVALFDIHYPEHDKKSMVAVDQFLQYFKPDSIVYGGDFLDMSPVSHWLQNKRRVMETQRLKKDYDGFNKMLQRHADVSKAKEMYFLTGNHEDWVEQYIDLNPELEGFLEVENNLVIPNGIKKNKIYKLNECHKIGKLFITHGIYTNQYHARKTVDNFNRNVLYGHVHDFQSYTKITPIDTEDVHIGQSIGCLCNSNPDYMKGRPNNWSHGFAVIYEDVKTGFFNVYPVRIVNGKFIFDGKTFGRK